LDILEVHALGVYLITADADSGNTRHGATEARRKLAVVPTTSPPKKLSS